MTSSKQIDIWVNKKLIEWENQIQGFKTCFNENANIVSFFCTLGFFL